MGRIPDRWENYSCVGKRIDGTRFISFKVPLKEILCRQLPSELKFTPWMLFSGLEGHGLQLGLVIDLTNTSRYYDCKEMENAGARYVKIFTEGHSVPSAAVQKTFFDAVDQFLMENADNAFNSARGHSIERENYLDDLLGADSSLCKERRSSDSVGKSSRSPANGFTSKSHRQHQEDRPRQTAHWLGDVHDPSARFQTRMPGYNYERTNSEWHHDPSSSYGWDQSAMMEHRGSWYPPNARDPEPVDGYGPYDSDWNHPGSLHGNPGWEHPGHFDPVAGYNPGAGPWYDSQRSYQYQNPPPQSSESYNGYLANDEMRWRKPRYRRGQHYHQQQQHLDEASGCGPAVNWRPYWRRRKDHTRYRLVRATNNQTSGNRDA